MRRSPYQEQFVDILTRLNQKIENLGKSNILSNNIYSENFYRDLLNKLFSYSLKNQNKIEGNAQGFDLIDEENKIIIQVSSTCTKQKIENTLKKEVIKKKQQEKYRIKFIFIGDQTENIKKKIYVNPQNILFNPNNDIILTSDLSKNFQDKSIDQQKEILELLEKELNPILFEDSLLYLNNEFIDEQVEFSISNLASRYSKENDIETVNNNVIEAIAITDDFKSKNISFLKNIKKYLEEDVKLESDRAMKEYWKYMKAITNFKQSLDHYLELETDFENKSEILKGIYELLGNVIENSDTFRIYDRDMKEDDQKNLLNFIRKIEDEVLAYNEYLKETSSECLFTPYLLIQGRAGIGKSHLLGHIAKKLREENHITYLFLGQHFTKNEDPWNQILKNLDIKSPINKFLQAVDSKGKELNKRAFIIIDALNEGEGKVLWENYFQSFINRIKKYSNIAFIFSIRTPFEDIILPKGAIEENNINTFQHNGFSEEGYEPIRSFCDYYGLELPTFPILNTEYENPLFLKLACEYCKDKSKTFEPTLKIAEIFNNIIKKVNVKLSKEEKFDFDKDLNVVHEVIKEIIELMSQSDYRGLNYEETYKVVNKIARNYLQKSGKFLEALIDENILSKSKDYHDEVIVYFSYERMGDYYLSDYLLKEYSNSSTKKDKTNLIERIKSDEKITVYFKNESNLSYNQGLIEELSIKLADECDIELFEIFTEYQESKYIVLSFINSLVWRTKNSINDNAKDFINKNVLPYKHYREAFLDVMLMKVSHKNHPLNANALHRLLGQCDLSTRDFIWTQFISMNSNSKNPSKIVNWVFDNYKKLDEVSAEMYMIVLTWLLTSTNKKLRDSSTKLLVKMFKEFPFLMIKILKLFEDNNDPYVVERLYASIYGGVVRSERCEEHIEIAKYIYNKVFAREFIYSHVLMRDYARQTIEYICLANSIPNINLNQIRPPYASEWYKKPYSNKEIDEFVSTKKVGLGKYAQIAISRIVSSMTTKYGRGTGAYGDFGRYVFGYSVRRWMNQFQSDQELSNYVIMRVFEMGYDAELQGEFDYFVSQFDRHNNSVERIGKKYQWIAFHELLAKLVDNFPTFDEKDIYTKEFYNYLEKKPKTTIRFIDENDEEETAMELVVDSSAHVVIQNKDDREKYIEKVIKVRNQQYTGPWLDDIRDIDPTILITKIEKGLNELIPRQLPKKATVEWVKGNDVFNETEMFLEIEIDNKKYISLASKFSYENRVEDSSYSERDSCFFFAMGYFFNKEKSNEIIQKNKKEYTNGITVPQTHNVFLYEHYWSESYQDYIRECDKGSREMRLIAIHDYTWELDSSFKEKSISFYIPSEKIINYFTLKQEKEGIWKNLNGEKVCLNSKLLGFDNECLLIDKEKFLEFLKANNFSIGWQVYLEKNSQKERQEWWYNVFYNDGIFDKYVSKNENSKIEHHF